jgi:hypothetical protein
VLQGLVVVPQVLLDQRVFKVQPAQLVSVQQASQAPQDQQAVLLEQPA